MSYASDARGELARENCTHDCCAKSELAAALLSSGGISYRGKNRYALSLTSAEGVVVRRYFAMLKQYWGIAAEIRTLHTESLKGQTRYQLVIPEEESLRLLDEMMLLDENALFGVRQTPRSELVNYACCKKSFVKGAFLMCGAVSNPDKEYHIEIAAPTEEFAWFIAKMLEYFEIPAKKTCRKSKYVVYLKKAEEISEMLTLIGASGSVLQLENVRIRKGVSNQVNRQLNCDASNINRTMNAAEGQIADIRYIDSEVGLEKLPRSLREIAEVRVNNPDTSLSGLGELLDPPIGKSGVNARLRKISDLARKLRAGEDTGLKY